MATIIIITPPPKKQPQRVQSANLETAQPQVTVLNVDVIEDASIAEILHAGLSGLEPDEQ